MNKLIPIATALALAGAGTSVNAGDFTANISASNNYLWRGLTQSENEPAVSGGIDYAHDSGLYVGTWVSNVSYATPDTFSYEHDMYIGFAGEYNEISYDFGYLYYNYDQAAEYFAKVEELGAKISPDQQRGMIDPESGMGSPVAE